MDQILKMLGRPGVYHILVVALLAVTWWSIALGNTAMTFYGFTPKFRCEIPQHNESGNAITYEGGGDDQSETVSLLSNITVSEDQCNYTLRLHTGETSVHRCSSWTYDTDHDNLKTIATEVSTDWLRAVGTDHCLAFFAAILRKKHEVLLIELQGRRPEGAPCAPQAYQSVSSNFTLSSHNVSLGVQVTNQVKS